MIEINLNDREYWEQQAHVEAEARFKALQAILVKVKDGLSRAEYQAAWARIKKEFVQNKIHLKMVGIRENG